MSDQKLKKYMDDLSEYVNRPSLTVEERIILATAMLYTTRIIYEENYGSELAINLIDTIGGGKVDYVKPTRH
tara:strand:+ start:45 stop:260 length:216 start_codon:yes stop_codon:yes gene_type:complete